MASLLAQTVQGRPGLASTGRPPSVAPTQGRVIAVRLSGSGLQFQNHLELLHGGALAHVVLAARRRHRVQRLVPLAVVLLALKEGDRQRLATLAAEDQELLGREPRRRPALGLVSGADLGGG